LVIGFIVILQHATTPNNKLSRICTAYNSLCHALNRFSHFCFCQCSCNGFQSGRSLCSQFPNCPRTTDTAVHCQLSHPFQSENLYASNQSCLFPATFLSHDYSTCDFAARTSQKSLFHRCVGLQFSSSGSCIHIYYAGTAGCISRHLSPGVYVTVLYTVSLFYRMQLSDTSAAVLSRFSAFVSFIHKLISSTSKSYSETPYTKSGLPVYRVFPLPTSFTAKQARIYSWKNCMCPNVDDLPVCVVLDPGVRCKIWAFPVVDYEECRLLGYENPVHTSQETYYVSATELSRLLLYKIWGFHGSVYEECSLLECDTV
jgi:hypothetical protein